MNSLDPWYPALLAILPLCCTSMPKLRTWTALAVAALMGWFLPPLSIAAYIVTDFLAASMVLRRPAGIAQKGIGVLFALMILQHVGFAISGQRDWQMYYAAQYAVGWIQLACLASWGLWDVGGILVRRRALRRAPAAHADI